MATCNCTGACFRFGYCSATSPRLVSPQLNTSITERCRCGSEISLPTGFYGMREELDGWRERHASHASLATEETEK